MVLASAGLLCAIVARYRIGGHGLPDSLYTHRIAVEDSRC